MVRRRQRIRFDALPDDTERLPGRERSPEQVYAEGAFDADVQAALDALPPDFRAAVVLCDIEGLSYEEIAATLGIKLGTVRSRIHRGRVLLREALAHRAPRSDPCRRGGGDPGGRGRCVVTLPDLHLVRGRARRVRRRHAVPGARTTGPPGTCGPAPSAGTAVDAEREAKALLGAAPRPELPAGLMARLLDVPMTADIGGTDRMLAIDGDELGWSVPARRARHAGGRAPGRRPGAAPTGRPAGAAATGRRAARGPGGPGAGWRSRWPGWRSG